MALSVPKLDNAALRLPQRASSAGRVTETAVYLLLALFFAVITAEELFAAPRIWVTAAMMAALALGLFILCRFERAKLLPPFIFALAAVLRLAYIYLIPTQPVSDFEILYSAAVSTAGGDFTWAQNDYFSCWAYQIPFVLYEALVYKLVPSMAVLKLMNAAWSVGIVYFIYRLSARFLPKRCALAAAFIYAVYPGQISYVPVLTNQHIAMFFLLLGLTVLFEARSVWAYMLSGAFLAVSNMMRPEGAIAAIALLMYCLCCFIEEPRAKKPVQLCGVLLAVLLTYFLFQKAAELILSALGAAPYGLDTSVPEWKLVVGLNTASGGQLTGEEDWLLSVTGAAERRTRAAAVIRGYFESCGDIAGFFFTKLKNFWTWSESGDFELGGVNTALITALGASVESVVSYMVCAEAGVRLLSYALAAAGALRFALRAARGSRGVNGEPLMLAAVLCGVILAYLIVEIQPRYRYTAMPFVFIFAASALSERMKNAWKK